MAISQINQNSLASGVPSSVASSALPAGSVLQVVNATQTGQASTSSATFVTTGFSASITPKFSTSKILIIYSGAIYMSTAGGSYQTIYRNSTALGNTNGLIQNQVNNAWVSCGTSYLDSPATTSSTTYTIYMKTNQTTYFGGDLLTSSITLLEIAA
jgi:hypothetical protein